LLIPDEGARDAADAGATLALLAAILPLTPGFSTGNAVAASMAAAVTAVVMVAIVPFAKVDERPSCSS